jgi:hypothetical protein
MTIPGHQKEDKNLCLSLWRDINFQAGYKNIYLYGKSS